MKTHPIVLFSVLALGLACADAADETAPRPEQASVKRTVLRRTPVPNSNFEVVLVLVEAPANARAGRHTHPGTVVGYVIEGEYSILIDGQPPRPLKTGDSLEVPAGAVHDERTTGKPAKLLAVFTVEKGKPLTTPAP
jgi:quercetin dioxygenase-like cupin family protein